MSYKSYSHVRFFRSKMEEDNDKRKIHTAFRRRTADKV